MSDSYNFAVAIEEYAREHGEQLAVFVHGETESKSLTYADLTREAARVQAALVQLGIKREDRVLVMLNRSLTAYMVYVGLIRMGVVILPSSEMLRAKDILYRVRHASVKAVIVLGAAIDEVSTALKDDPQVIRIVAGGTAPGYLCLDDLLQAVSGPAPEPALTSVTDMAFLSYTSGTTGGPKGVVHTHGWPRAHIANAATHWFDVQPGEWAWATAGPGWAKWIWSPFVSILGKGGTAFVYAGRFSPEGFLDLLERYPIGLLCATPTEYRLMIKSKRMETWHPLSLRSAVSAGEPLNREVIETFHRQCGVWVRDGYGQTENSLLVCVQQGMTVKPGSMGRPSPGYQVAIIDDDAHALGIGGVGHIALQKDTPTLFREYLYDAERTARAFLGDYYITGDLGRLDEEGYIWFEGRADDMIISAGYTIGPFEVEDALTSHSAVAECAAVASPDEERGHVVKAFVVLKAGYTPDEELTHLLQEHVKQVTAPYKYPREIEYVTELPKTASGKIRRVELRTLERQRKALPRK